MRRTALTLLRVNQPTGFDCPGLRLARPRPHPHGRVLRERRQGRRRGGHPAPGRPRLLRASTRSRTSPGSTDYWLGQQGRLAEPMYKPAGADHYEPIDWEGAFALDRRAAARAADPGRRGVLHLGPHLQRGGVPLPADGAPLRHQQPARLLEHVPRVQRRRAGPLDRHRQGLGAARGHLRRRPDHGRRAEPRHQPPADALGAGAGQAERRLHRQHQPARRGRAAHLPQPADPEGSDQGRGPHRRLPPGAALRRPGAVRGDGEADRRGGGGRRGVRRRRTPRSTTSTSPTSTSSTGTRYSPPPG